MLGQHRIRNEGVGRSVERAFGHHALALVKDIERLVRIAKSRIGPARDGFVELGDRLARSVPHFLPTFYEEAARAFLAADSPTYAASMFAGVVAVLAYYLWR